MSDHLVRWVPYRYVLHTMSFLSLVVVSWIERSRRKLGTLLEHFNHNPNRVKGPLLYLRGLKFYYEF